LDKTGPQLIVDGMKEAGVNFVASLPDANLAKLLALVDSDPELTHLTLCREEEGVGICTGAYTADGFRRSSCKTAACSTAAMP
jgi:sulfopyruvate decarboxylase subunit alpha